MTHIPAPHQLVVFGQLGFGWLKAHCGPYLAPGSGFGDPCTRATTPILTMAVQKECGLHRDCIEPFCPGTVQNPPRLGDRGAVDSCICCQTFQEGHVTECPCHPIKEDFAWNRNSKSLGR